jgi:hypothetical protein
MPLPPSFAQSGFSPGQNALKSRKRIKLPNGRYLKPLLIGTEGETDTGKTEFLMSCPRPGIILALDKAFDPCLDNPNPPEWRDADSFYFDVTAIPAETTGSKEDYVEYFTTLRTRYYAALDNPDALTIATDCDSDFWELHRLAEFGKLAGIWPQTLYHKPYAQKRAMISKAWESGKVIIAANKLRAEYKAEPDDKGNDVSKPTGKLVRSGFPDQSYLWTIQLRHLFEPKHINLITKKEVPNRWGIRILKCKANMELVGEELWGDDCNFAGLVQFVYPNIPIEDWGF